MDTFNIREARTHLSRLLERVARGSSFIIARAGKPVARVTPVDPVPSHRHSRLGFMTGTVRVPEDFDQMGQAEIDGLFDGSKVDGPL